jgi:hypothetical protein
MGGDICVLHNGRRYMCITLWEEIYVYYIMGGDICVLHYGRRYMCITLWEEIYVYYITSHNVIHIYLLPLCNTHISPPIMLPHTKANQTFLNWRRRGAVWKNIPQQFQCFNIPSFLYVSLVKKYKVFVCALVAPFHKTT